MCELCSKIRERKQTSREETARQTAGQTGAEERRRRYQYEQARSMGCQAILISYNTSQLLNHLKSLYMLALIIDSHT